ncbi:MAG: hypothetical protein LC792_28495, partial [Actinobacteria bacterium]|nr:hypothetical protein [Actinomycetota bacterium]
MSDTSDGDPAAFADPGAEPTPAAALPPPRRRGRRGRRILVGIAVVVVVVAAAYWRQTVNSDPKLRFTMFNRVNRDGETFSGFPADVHRTQAVSGDAQVEIPFVAGQRVFLYLGLRNDGGRAVQINKLPAAGFYYFGFDGMEMVPNGEVGEATPYEPFKPFTLKAGEEHKVRLIFRMADCPPVGPPQSGFTSIHGLL